MKNFSDLDFVDDEGKLHYFEDTLTYSDNFFVDNGISTLPDDGEKLLLRLAFRQLTNQQKEIINYIYFQGKTQREIAQELNITQQAVGKHLQSALVKLRKICLGNKNQARDVTAVDWPIKKGAGVGNDYEETR